MPRTEHIGGTGVAAVLTAVLLGTAAAGQEATLPKLVDVTEAAGIRFVHSIGDDDMTNLVEATGAGVCFFDHDGDGDLDAYFVNGSYQRGISDIRFRKLDGKLSNALYRNDGAATFTDVTAAAGVGHQGYGMACVAADYDNDGDSDLFVTNFGPNVLYRNEGNGTFTDVTAAAGLQKQEGLWSVGATFLDYDRDGKLDLYVGNYVKFDPKYRNFYAPDKFPGPLAYEGQPDVLYRNKGDGTFEDVTQKAGLLNPEGRAMGVSSGDMDADGDMDVFVANDAMMNDYFVNNGDGTFTNAAATMGVGFGASGESTSAMSPELGDFDLDGSIDVLVPDLEYTCLYHNSGEGQFTERSAALGIAAVTGQYTGWSGNFFDFDGDAYPDILISTGDGHKIHNTEECLLFRNEAGKRFTDVSARLGEDFHDKFIGRGSAVGDYDGDGDLDVLILNLNARPRLLRNDGGNRNHWLLIRTVGTTSNRDGIGTRIRLTAGGLTQTRLISSSSGYLSQSDFRAHFGLGQSQKADKIELHWPSGKLQTLEDVAADQVLTVREPAP